jgi:hypothetical protein
LAGSKDADTTIEYAALVGGETGTYYRGTARLQDGKGTAELPEHFSLVTEEAQGKERSISRSSSWSADGCPHLPGSWLTC